MAEKTIKVSERKKIMKRPLDKTKKSNVKCEHCAFYDKNAGACLNPASPKYQKAVNYWNRCKYFGWHRKYGA